MRGTKNLPCPHVWVHYIGSVLEVNNYVKVLKNLNFRLDRIGKLLVIIYTMLKQGTLFDESCFEARCKNCEQKQLSRYVRELEKHGYHVEAWS